MVLLIVRPGSWQQIWVSIQICNLDTEKLRHVVLSVVGARFLYV